MKKREGTEIQKTISRSAENGTGAPGYSRTAREQQNPVMEEYAELTDTVMDQTEEQK